MEFGANTKPTSQVIAMTGIGVLWLVLHLMSPQPDEDYWYGCGES